MSKAILFRSALSIGATALALAAASSAPDNQFGFQTPIVRIFYTNPDGTAHFNGTGAIFDNMNVKGKGWFCVLTADHVIAEGGPDKKIRAVHPGLGIAFGQYNGVDLTGFPGGGNVIAGRLQGALGPTGKVDIAVLGVPYGDYNKDYDQYVMPLGDEALGVGDIFSSAGYGRVGVRLVEAVKRSPSSIPAGAGMWWNGYDGMASDQTQRFYYNSVDSLDTINDDFLKPRDVGLPDERSVEPYPGSEPPDGIHNNPRQGYVYDGIQYDNTAPTGVHATVGEGVGYGGDSGAPYMLWDPLEARQVIAGVHTYGFYLNDMFGNATQMKLWDFEAGGVNLTDPYRTWIETQCAAVPEPGALGSLAIGVLGLVVRRRRRAR